TEGDEFEVYMPRTERSWGSRPELPIARLQVIRADGRTASARVVSLSQPALRAGLPVRLVAKMP
ncbi:MAG: hypothetical protein M3409_04620, partial [Gemmatimonadota bacterium]|nr:hypothetical protein [Gemmatimonadota bacterium]